MSLKGDYNCRSTNWWEDDIENDEGKLFEPFTSDLGLHQLINESTHSVEILNLALMFFTDQPNLFLASGVHPYLHKNCHHQIIYGKQSVRNLHIGAGFGFMTVQTLLQSKKH